ncbi:MAG: DEAD/DEAH box helicase [Bacillota bacterium]
MKYYELLSEPMKAALGAMGYTEPTPIQAKTLELILQKRDILGTAQTGTGKTAAFAVPIIERVFEESRRTQALVLCPTRELALQTTEVFRKLTAGRKIRTVSVYGGQSPTIQIHALRAGAQIVVGTPGRIKDLIGRNVLKLQSVRVAVLDEADEMLDYGFLPDIRSILSYVTGEHQTLLFSATMSKPIAEIAQEFLNEPARIEVGQRNEPTKAVAQSFLTAIERQKSGAVQRLIVQEQPRLALVFCNTRRRVKTLQKQLFDQGLAACCLHGDMSQNQRDAIMRTFRRGESTVLVATDVAARGIDVDDIDLVINYDVPDKLEYYVHRIGRTGRAGRAGKACTLICPQDKRKIFDIERRFHIKLAEEAVLSC